MTIDAGVADLVGVRAAARALGLNASTVSRYLKDHPDLNLGSERRPMVNLEELRRHREENINAARSGSHAGRLLGEDNGVAGANGADAANGRERPTRNQAEAPSLATARAEREAALAERARLDLDEKLAGLLVRSEVEEAFEETLQVLRRQLSDLAPRLAERLATLDTAEEAQALMETEFRGLLSKCARELGAWA